MMHDLMMSVEREGHIPLAMSNGQRRDFGDLWFQFQKNAKWRNAMDSWDFLKWRKTLRYTQAEVAAKLGINRSTVQNWERGITPISKSAELASQELTREWKQRPEFGPVTLVYSDDPIWRHPDESYHTALLKSELCRSIKTGRRLHFKATQNNFL